MNGIFDLLRKNDGWTCRALISIGLDQHHAFPTPKDRHWRFAASLASHG
jgi:hypothetical protein